MNKSAGIKPLKMQKMTVIGLEKSTRLHPDGEGEYSNYQVVLLVEGKAQRFLISREDYGTLKTGDHLAMSLVRVTDA